METLDDSVGRLLAHLDASGLREHTIVIFTSDNGGLHVPEGPHPRVDAQHAVPRRQGLPLRGRPARPAHRPLAGHPAGASIDTPVMNTDWLPTLLELAGRARRADLDGVEPDAAAAHGQAGAAARTFFWHFPHYTNQGSRPAGAVRDGRWKLVEHYDDGQVELFDLDADVEREPRSVEDRGGTGRGAARSGCASGEPRWRRRRTHRIPASTPSSTSSCMSSSIRRGSIRFAPTARRGRRVAPWRQRMDAAVKLAAAK